MELNLTSLLAGGLRRESLDSRANPGLVACTGAKSLGPLGLASPFHGQTDDTAAYVAAGCPAIAFPDPQIHKGRHFTLLTKSNAFYFYDPLTHTTNQIHFVLTNYAETADNHAFTTALTSWTAVNWAWASGGIDPAPGYAHCAVAGATLTQTPSAGIAPLTKYVVYLRARSDTGNKVRVSLAGGTAFTSATLSSEWSHHVFPLTSGAGTNIVITSVGGGCDVDYISVALEAFATTTYPWHMADFGPVALLFDGVGTNTAILAFRWDHGSLTYRAYIESAFAINTGCNYRGRLVMGGFGTTLTYGKPLFNTANALSLVNGVPLPGQDAAFFNATSESVVGISLTPRHVWWSSITGQDLLQWFFPDDALAAPGPVTGSYADASEAWDEITSLNQQGSRVMPWQGSVKRLVPALDGVAVYGSDGVGALLPLTGSVPTFAYRHLADTGIAGTNAVAGDLRSHAWVDAQGYLWRTSSSLACAPLGYQEFLGALYGPTIQAFHDPRRDEFFFAGMQYITGPPKLDIPWTFILSSDALTCTGGALVALTYDSGDLLYLLYTTGASLVLDITSGPIDFGGRGQETLVAFECCTTGTGLRLAIDGRTGTGSTWAEMCDVPVSRPGLQALRATATELRLRLYAPTASLVTRIETLKLIANPNGRRSLNHLIRS